MQHVSGVETQLADMLSRLRAFLIKVHGKPALEISGDYNPKLHLPLTPDQQKQLDSDLKTLTNQMNGIRKELTMKARKHILGFL